MNFDLGFASVNENGNLKLHVDLVNNNVYAKFDQSDHMVQNLIIWFKCYGHENFTV